MKITSCEQNSGYGITLLIIYNTTSDRAYTYYIARLFLAAVLHKTLFCTQCITITR